MKFHQYRLTKEDLICMHAMIAFGFSDSKNPTDNLASPRCNIDLAKDSETARIDADKFDCEWIPDKKPWEVLCDIEVPTATENELDEGHTKELVKNGCIAMCEGANMPCTPEAVHVFHDQGILYAPGKAANACGVSASGLEMTQNSMRLSWTREEPDISIEVVFSDIRNVQHPTSNTPTLNSSIYSIIPLSNRISAAH